MSESTGERNTKAGIVALAGAPNVGKSTLLNRILGRHLSIESAKPQTTRVRIAGIENRGGVQLVFTDTPGIHRPRERGGLNARMVASARAGIHGADVVCWLLAADRGLTPVDRAEAENLAQARTVAVINKIDTVARDALLPIMAAVGELLPESDCLPLSARSGEGVEALVDLLCDAAPKGPWLFEGDQITDQNERLLFAELVREQLFRQMSQELPYRVAVVVDEFSRVGGEIRLAASVFTDSDGSKKMIVGKGGRRIKSIGIAARRAAAELAGTTVHLSLQVRVKKNWQRDTAFLRELGL